MEGREEDLLERSPSTKTSKFRMKVLSQTAARQWVKRRHGWG